MKLLRISIILTLLTFPFIFSCNKNVTVKLIEEHDPIVKVIEEHDSMVVFPADSNKIKQSNHP
jgi:hypothetical protein